MTPRRRLVMVLWAAGVVSVACNVLAADSGLVARSVGAWFPIALLLVVHVFGEVRLPAGWPRRAAISGATLVAVAAAVASFNHMHEIALDAGEPPLVAILFPLSVDGLAVVASVALTALDHPHPHTTPAPAVDLGIGGEDTGLGAVDDDQARRVGVGTDRWLVPSLVGGGRPDSPVPNGSGPNNNSESEVQKP